MFNKYGIRGWSLDIFRSYLTNRMQHVRQDINTITYGSKLGPLLFLFFLMYKNDIFDLHLKGKILLFVADAAIYYVLWTTRFLVSHT